MTDKIVSSSEEKKTLRARFSEKRANFKENHPLAHRLGTEVIAGAAYGAIVGIVALGLVAGSKLTDSEDDSDEE